MFRSPAAVARKKPWVKEDPTIQPAYGMRKRKAADPLASIPHFDTYKINRAPLQNLTNAPTKKKGKKTKKGSKGAKGPRTHEQPPPHVKELIARCVVDGLCAAKWLELKRGYDRRRVSEYKAIYNKKYGPEGHFSRTSSSIQTQQLSVCGDTHARVCFFTSGAGL